MNIDEELYDKDIWLKAFERLNNKQYLSSGERKLLLYMLEHRNEYAKSIINGGIELEIPQYREITKINGKKRVIYVFSLEERFILGVVSRCLSKVFADKISKNCFSYKTNVCTLDAIKYLKNNFDLTDKVCVRIDISKYFNTVSQDYLLRCIDELFIGNENSALYSFVKKVYSIDCCIKNGEIVQEYMGLIPGTSISNFFGNYCLTEIDRRYLDNEKIAYARYADDIIMFADSKEELDAELSYIKEYIRGIGLSINDEKNEWYAKNTPVTFLGLSFIGDEIDISPESFKKMKQKIKHSCKMGRKSVEMNRENPKKVIADIIKKYNSRFYKCYIVDKSKYGWGYYAFRYITTNKTLIELDHYFKDRLRYVMTGKNIKSNFYKLTEEDLGKLGYVSTSFMYGLFKSDFDAYCTYIDLMK